MLTPQEKAALHAIEQGFAQLTGTLKLTVNGTYIRRRASDELIRRVCWQVDLAGSGYAASIGQGDTLVQAYADAKAKAAALPDALRRAA